MCESNHAQRRGSRAFTILLSQCLLPVIGPRNAEDWPEAGTRVLKSPLCEPLFAPDGYTVVLFCACSRENTGYRIFLDFNFLDKRPAAVATAAAIVVASGARRARQHRQLRSAPLASTGRSDWTPRTPGGSKSQGVAQFNGSRHSPAAKLR